MCDTAKDPQAEIYNRGYRCGVMETEFKHKKAVKTLTKEEVADCIWLKSRHKISRADSEYLAKQICSLAIPKMKLPERMENENTDGRAAGHNQCLDLIKEMNKE